MKNEMKKIKKDEERSEEEEELLKAIRSSEFYRAKWFRFREKARRYQRRGDFERACDFYVKGLNQLRQAVACRFAKTNSPSARHNIEWEIFKVQEELADFGMEVYYSRDHAPKPRVKKEIPDAIKYLLLGKEYPKNDNPLLRGPEGETGAYCCVFKEEQVANPLLNMLK